MRVSKLISMAYTSLPNEHGMIYTKDFSIGTIDHTTLDTFEGYEFEDAVNYLIMNSPRPRAQEEGLSLFCSNEGLDGRNKGVSQADLSQALPADSCPL